MGGEAGASSARMDASQFARRTIVLGGRGLSGEPGMGSRSGDDQPCQRAGGAERSGINRGSGGEVFQAGARVVGLDLVCNAAGVGRGAQTVGQTYARRNCPVPNRRGSSTY